METRGRWRWIDGDVGVGATECTGEWSEDPGAGLPWDQKRWGQQTRNSTPVCPLPWRLMVSCALDALDIYMCMHVWRVGGANGRSLSQPPLDRQATSSPSCPCSQAATLATRQDQQDIATMAMAMGMPDARWGWRWLWLAPAMLLFRWGSAAMRKSLPQSFHGWRQTHAIEKGGHGESHRGPNTQMEKKEDARNEMTENLVLTTGCIFRISFNSELDPRARSYDFQGCLYQIKYTAKKSWNEKNPPQMIKRTDFGWELFFSFNWVEGGIGLLRGFFCWSDKGDGKIGFFFFLTPWSRKRQTMKPTTQKINQRNRENNVCPFLCRQGEMDGGWIVMRRRWGEEAFFPVKKRKPN